jgi:chromosome segregation ATPase
MAEKSQSSHDLLDAKLNDLLQDINKYQEHLSEKADHLETSMAEKSQTSHDLLDAKLNDLLQDINKYREQLTEKAAHLETSMAEKSQSSHDLLDAKLNDLLQDINKYQEQLSEKAAHLETSMAEKSQTSHDLLDARLDNLSQKIETISNKLLFIIDQNEASSKRILAFQSIVEELFDKLNGFENEIACNSNEVHELKTQVVESDERLTSLEYGFEAKISGLVNRLRSAIVRRFVWS